MFIKNIFKYLLYIFFIFIVSCSSINQKKIESKKTYPLTTLYKQAYQYFEEGNFYESIKIFEIVEQDYSYTEWAPKSLLMRAFMFYEAANYIETLVLLQRFKKRYPGNKNMAYVEYLTAICLFEQINFISMSQENTELAKKQFDKIIKNYPNSSYATDAKFKMDLINEQFAGKEMYLARYYAKREKWVPALYRLNNILKNYQTTIYVEEALHRLVEINYKIGNISSAKKYASILGYNFNQSDWYKKSYRIIDGKNFVYEKEKQKKTLKEKILQLIQMK